jgi:hypothetical protein
MVLFREKVKDVLSEFFENIKEGRDVDKHMSVSIFGNLFESSSFELKDLYLRKEVVNSLHLPFRLLGGYVGLVKVTGITDGIFDGRTPMKIEISDVCIVLGENPGCWDEETFCRSKQMQVELFEKLSPPKKERPAEEKPPDKDHVPFFTEPAKKGLLEKKLEFLIENFQISIKNVHIRFESEYVDDSSKAGQPPNLTSITRCNAFGVIIPKITINAANNVKRLISRRKLQTQVPVNYQPTGTIVKKMLALNELQIYCDYNVETYCYSDAGAGSPALREVFLKRWSNETHTGLLLPMTVRILIELERVEPEMKATSPKSEGSVPKYNVIAIDLDVKLGVKVAIDCRQWVVIAGIAEHMHDFTRITTYRRQFGYIRVWDQRRIPPPTNDASEIVSTAVAAELTRQGKAPGTSTQHRSTRKQTAGTQTQRSWWGGSKRSAASAPPKVPVLGPPPLPRQTFASTAGGGYMRDVQPSMRETLGAGWARKLWWYAFECVKFDLRQHFGTDFLHKLLEKGHFNRKRTRYTRLYKKHLRKVEDEKRVAIAKSSPIMTMLGAGVTLNTINGGEMAKECGAQRFTDLENSIRLEERWVLHDLEQQLDLSSVLEFRQLSYFELYDERTATQGVGPTSGVRGSFRGTVAAANTSKGSFRSKPGGQQLAVVPEPEADPEVDETGPAAPQLNFFVKDMTLELREPIVVVSQQQVKRLEREVGVGRGAADASGDGAGGASTETGSAGRSDAEEGGSVVGAESGAAGGTGIATGRSSGSGSGSGSDSGSGKPGMRSRSNMKRRKILQAKLCSVRGNVMAERDYLDSFASPTDPKARARAKAKAKARVKKRLDRGGASPWAAPNGARDAQSDGKDKGIHFFLAELKLGSLTVQHWPPHQDDGRGNSNTEEDSEVQEHPIFTGARSSEVNNEFLYVGIKMDPHGFTAVPVAPVAAAAAGEADGSQRGETPPPTPISTGAKVWGWRVLVAVGPIAIDNHLAARHHLASVLCTGGNVTRSVVRYSKKHDPVQQYFRDKYVEQLEKTMKQYQQYQHNQHAQQPQSMTQYCMVVPVDPYSIVWLSNAKFIHNFEPNRTVSTAASGQRAHSSNTDLHNTDAAIARQYSTPPRSQYRSEHYSAGAYTGRPQVVDMSNSALVDDPNFDKSTPGRLRSPSKDSAEGDPRNPGGNDPNFSGGRRRRKRPQRKEQDELKILKLIDSEKVGGSCNPVKHARSFFCPPVHSNFCTLGPYQQLEANQKSPT